MKKHKSSKSSPNSDFSKEERKRKRDFKLKKEESAERKIKNYKNFDFDDEY